MKVIKKAINFDVNQITQEELPFLNYFYLSKRELNKDITDLFEFPIAHKEAMPFYTVQEGNIPRIKKDFESYYQMMLDALVIAFKDEALLNKYFDCSFMRKWGKKFVPYAKHTFAMRHPALYGRFDACFDPDNETIKGVYEFNGDTPVMLFESVNLQARFSEELGTEQWNDWWHTFTKKFKDRYRNVAVVCDTGYVDDMATCETIAQAFYEACGDGTVGFVDLKELDYDHAQPRNPWFIKGSYSPLDAMYILSPWEEMVENFPAMLDGWERWADNVHVFEPAWRWFLSHKGMTALCTHLMNEEYEFCMKWNGVPLLPTYLTWDDMVFWEGECMSVEKPVIGRLSNNIRVHGKSGNLLSDTGGYYSEENTVHQVFSRPGRVAGRNNFILGMWMCDDEAVSFCAREFDEEVLSTTNERFIPHIVLED